MEEKSLRTLNCKVMSWSMLWYVCPLCLGGICSRTSVVPTCVDTQVLCTHREAFASSLTLEHYLWMYPSKAMPIAVTLYSLRNNDNKSLNIFNTDEIFLKHFVPVVDWIHKCKSHRDRGLSAYVVDRGGNTNDQNLLHKKDKIQIY